MMHLTTTISGQQHYSLPIISSKIVHKQTLAFLIISILLVMLIEILLQQQYMPHALLNFGDFLSFDDLDPFGDFTPLQDLLDFNDFEEEELLDVADDTTTISYAL